jgi:hypothetical protein
MFSSKGQHAADIPPFPRGGGERGVENVPLCMYSTHLVGQGIEVKPYVVPPHTEPAIWSKYTYYYTFGKCSINCVEEEDLMKNLKNQG